MVRHMQNAQVQSLASPVSVEVETQSNDFQDFSSHRTALSMVFSMVFSAGDVTSCFRESLLGSAALLLEQRSAVIGIVRPSSPKSSAVSNPCAPSWEEKCGEKAMGSAPGFLEEG